MPIDILMPALSPTMEEGVLAKWHIKVGDIVKSGDIMAEIETDKATMEYEAVDEGEVLEILVPEGTNGVKINQVIARLKGEGGETKAPMPVAAAPIAAPALKPAPIDVKPAQSAQISAPIRGERLKASPLARRIAEQKGLDLSTIKGTGPQGRIIRIDVENLAPALVAAPIKGEAKPSSAPINIASLPYKAGNYDIVPLDGMRRTIAKRLTQSFRDVPHFPLNIEIEIDRTLAARAEINQNSDKSGVKISVNDIIIKACALALKAVPKANASYTDEAILLHHHADVAVAVAIEGGLITPVIRMAETKGLQQISSEMKELAAKAKARKLMPEDYSGGTFSLSNLGMYGIKSFSSIINEPQGCILSVGAGEQRPIVKNGALAIANVMTVTLTCDHRVVDGAVGAEWLNAFKSYLENPFSMML